MLPPVRGRSDPRERRLGLRLVFLGCRLVGDTADRFVPGIVVRCTVVRCTVVRGIVARRIAKDRIQLVGSGKDLLLDDRFRVSTSCIAAASVISVSSIIG